MQAKKVLIVEDESIVALDISQSLEGLGFQTVGRAASGKKAVELASHRPPDIALMDIKLSGSIDGITTAQTIVEQHDIPIVFLTAHADPSTVERAQSVGPYGYLVKPFTDQELFAALQIALHRHGLDRGKHISRQSPHNDELQKPLIAANTDHIRNPHIYSFLQSLPIFANASESELTTLANASQTQEVRSGQVVYWEGEANPCPFVVYSGRISILKSAEDGRELLIDILPEQDSFGLLASLEDQAASATARAQVDAQIIAIPKAALSQLLRSDPQLSLQFAQALATRLRDSYEFAQNMAHNQVRNKTRNGTLQVAPPLFRGRQSRQCRFRGKPTGVSRHDRCHGRNSSKDNETL